MRSQPPSIPGGGGLRRGRFFVLRKVQDGEFAKMKACHGVIDQRRVDGIVLQRPCNSSAINSYQRPPPSRCRALYPPKSPAIGGLPIDIILPPRCDPQICAPVIEAVAIDVINQLRSRSAQDQSMHVAAPCQSRLCATAAIDRVKSPCRTLDRVGVPFNPGDEMFIFIVNDGEQAARERCPRHIYAARSWGGSIPIRAAASCCHAENGTCPPVARSMALAVSASGKRKPLAYRFTAAWLLPISAASASCELASSSTNALMRL